MSGVSQTPKATGQEITVPLHTQIQDAQKAIQQQHQARNQGLPIDHAAMLRLGMSMTKIEKGVKGINNTSLEEQFALLSDDFDTLKTRVRFVAQRNNISSRHVLLNMGGTKPVLSSIVEFLNPYNTVSCAKVNKHCRVAVKGSSLSPQLGSIRRMNVAELKQYVDALRLPKGEFEDVMPEEEFEGVLKQCIKLEEFDFQGWQGADYTTIRLIIDSLPETVTVLNNIGRIEKETLKIAADKFPQLTTIRIEDGIEIDDEDLQYLGKKCPISRLHIKDCYDITSQGLQAFPSLRELSIDNCPELSITEAMVICKGLTSLHVCRNGLDDARDWQAIWEAIAANCKGLQNLKIKSSDQEAYHHQGCLAIARNCPKLTHLSLQCKIPLAHIGELVPAFSQIKSLEILMRMQRISDWLALAKRCPLITQKELGLYFDFANDDEIREFTEVYPSVHRLELFSSEITDAGLRAIARAYKSKLTTFAVYIAKGSFTDQGISELARCSKLSHVGFIENSILIKVKFEWIKAMLENCSLASLRCSNQDNPEFASIRRNYPHVSII